MIKNQRSISHKMKLSFIDIIKTIVRLFFGANAVRWIGAFRHKRALKYNFRKDYLLYKEHSFLFSKNSIEKKEALITLYYHAIEKGFLHTPLRYRFGKDKIKTLLLNLKDEDVVKNLNRTQIQAAITNLCYYYEQHQEANQKINDYFPEEDYFWLKERLNQSCSSTIQTNKKDYFHFSESDYFNFSNSRHSVRSYSGEIIPKEKLEAVITLANNAPSVCNRQSASVYVIENKQQIEKLVEIQGGLKGFSENLNQLIILTTNRNYFSSIGERYQFYIDGGIYLMNLLYALHYYQIVACPAHWAMTVEDDEYLRQIVGIPESHKVICFVGIGMPIQNFPITLSLKRSATDNLHFI